MTFLQYIAENSVAASFPHKKTSMTVLVFTGWVNPLTFKKYIACYAIAFTSFVRRETFLAELFLW